MAALRAEDMVILRSPTRNPMGFGLAPPPPPSRSGGGGFGSGGFHGGGFVGSARGSGGISGGGVGAGMVGGGSGSLFEAPTQQFSPRKSAQGPEAFEEPPTVFNEAYNLPSAHNAFMDYTRHVDLDLLAKLGAVSIGSVITRKGATLLQGKAITLLLVSLSWTALMAA